MKFALKSMASIIFLMMFAIGSYATVVTKKAAPDKGASYSGHVFGIKNFPIVAILVDETVLPPLFSWPNSHFKPQNLNTNSKAFYGSYGIKVYNTNSRPDPHLTPKASN